MIKYFIKSLGKIYAMGQKNRHSEKSRLWFIGRVNPGLCSANILCQAVECQGVEGTVRVGEGSGGEAGEESSKRQS